MDRFGRKNDDRDNAHMSPSIFISSGRAYYRNDGPSSRTQQSLPSNTTSPYLYKQSLLSNVPKAGKTRGRFLHTHH